VTVHIQLPDGSAFPHPGLSNLLDVQVDATTDTVVVRAQVPNPEGIFLDQAGSYVLVVDEAKKVELRRVTTGVEQGIPTVRLSG
jgi:membrane fusion protein (multidrug efflux system)